MVENLFFQKDPLQDLLSSLNAVISTNESTQICNPAYTYKFQLKTTHMIMGFARKYFILPFSDLSSYEHERQTMA